MDAKGRRQLQLSDRVYERLAKEKPLPTAATLRVAQNSVNDDVETAFLNFWKVSLSFIDT